MRRCRSGMVMRADLWKPTPPWPVKQSVCSSSERMLRRANTSSSSWPTSESFSPAVGVVVLVDGVADGAVEVAGRGDRHHRQVDLLLVRGAGAAVEGAPLLDRLADSPRRRVRGDEGEAVEIPLDRGGDEALLFAV